MHGPASFTDGSTEGRYALWLLAAVAGLTLFRLAALALSRTDLFFDEAQYWFWSRDLASGYYSKPPLIAWIIRAATELCGMGEACIRSPSPIIHGATALVVGAVGRALYDARIGFWSGLVYATLPGVSFSSGLISTDVPLLFCVALGLLAVVRMRADASWVWAVLLGLAVGFGALAKYAMGLFLVSLAVYAAIAPAGRALLRDARLYAAFAIAALLIAPNIVWNARNGFATIAHTADNAAWGGPLIQPANALEFLAAQFGVFGPVLFACFLTLCWRFGAAATAQDRDDATRLLLAFSVPALTIVLAQALISRAHANWAAFAYIAATILVTAALKREGWTRLFQASLALHLAAMIVLGIGGALAGRLALPGGDPYARVLGWRALAEAAADKAKAGGYRAIATDRRALAAELSYYLRDRELPVFALRGDRPPRDHFELVRPLTADAPRPVLIVSLSERGNRTGEADGSAQIAAGTERRAVYFYRLTD